MAETIKRNSDIIKERLGVHLLIKYVLVREVNKYTKFPVLKDIHLTDNFSEIIEDKSLDIIVEVMGGITPAKEYIFSALEHGLSVVSANKDLVALYGPDIIHKAIENHVNFSCEASVGGGIPILMPLHQSLAANQIESIVGILNGTTNYILSQMTETGVNYANALADAQNKDLPRLIRQ